VSSELGECHSYARSGRLAARSRFTRAGVRTTIGTDANAVDIIADLRMAAINSKLESGDATAGSAWELVEAATAMAADVLGRPDLGRIEPGATADLIAIDLAQAHLQPVYDPIKVLVWNGTGRDVHFVMVAGEALITDGRFIRGPEREIVAAGAAAMHRVWSRAEERRVIEPVAGPGAR
jgi:5-methylthioadenosine/S-adenosylhomocysteine deaminase